MLRLPLRRTIVPALAATLLAALLTGVTLP